MRVFITGVSCVGKSTIGRKLPAELGYRFFDLDLEIEKHFAKPLESLFETTAFFAQMSKEGHAARARMV
jgi:shikimate kinase